MIRTLPAGRTVLPLAAVPLLVLAGCVTVGVHTTGAGSVDDLKAENAYVAVYTDHMTVVRRDNEAFAPSGANPGVCNKGGTKQGCYDADAKVVADYTAMLEALKATAVPPRFVEADRLLRDAITIDIQGLEMRNQALANGDDSAWQQSNVLIKQAGVGFSAAFAAFPSDNRPALTP